MRVPVDQSSGSPPKILVDGTVGSERKSRGKRITVVPPCRRATDADPREGHHHGAAGGGWQFLNIWMCTPGPRDMFALLILREV